MGLNVKNSHWMSTKVDLAPIIEDQVSIVVLEAYFI
jgi:hypothetical protein